jgi:hypothetical protein
MEATEKDFRAVIYPWKVKISNTGDKGNSRAKINIEDQRIRGN